MGNITPIDKNIRKREEENYPDDVEIMCIDADLETGEAEVDIYPEFDALEPLMQMDLLQDILTKLSKKYEEAVHEFGGTH